MKKLGMFLLIVTGFLFNGCATAGYLVGGQQKSYVGEYSLEYAGGFEQSKEKLKQVLKKEGWNKSQELERELKYEDGSSTAVGLLTSKVSKTVLRIYFQEDKIKFNLHLVGNYNHGTEQEADKIYNKIKEEYQK